jgi:hypothetical protein
MSLSSWSGGEEERERASEEEAEEERERVLRQRWERYRQDFVERQRLSRMERLWEARQQASIQSNRISSSEGVEAGARRQRAEFVGDVGVLYTSRARLHWNRRERNIRVVEIVEADSSQTDL